MAEFQEVIKQWKRRCEHCGKNERVGCVINGNVCEGFYKTREYIDPEFIERDVMQWAAKHPEPVYPTWIDWLTDMGLIIKTADHYGFNFTAAVDQIPADIAQKLGIEPKEV